MVSARSVIRITTEESRVNSKRESHQRVDRAEPSALDRLADQVGSGHGWRCATVISVPLPVATDDPSADHVEAQRQHEENEADEEQRLERS